MPRKPREKSSSGIYHVMLRGINRQIIFEDNEDRTAFLDTLTSYKKVCEYKIYGYCLMGNHVHLLIHEGMESISSAIKKICASYVYWYNHKYERCGHLFQDRFKSEPVEEEAYLLTVLRYIHQNPVKAVLTISLSESNWTSYHEYCCGRAKLVDIDLCLNLFSNDREEAVRLFIEYMHESNEDQCLDNEPRIKVSDEEICNCIQELGFGSSGALQRLDREIRNEVLMKLGKLEGVSVRQLSRITGVSKSVIADVIR